MDGRLRASETLTRWSASMLAGTRTLTVTVESSLCACSKTAHVTPNLESGSDVSLCNRLKGCFHSATLFSISSITNGDISIVYFSNIKSADALFPVMDRVVIFSHSHRLDPAFGNLKQKIEDKMMQRGWRATTSATSSRSCRTTSASSPVSSRHLPPISPRRAQDQGL